MTRTAMLLGSFLFGLAVTAHAGDEPKRDETKPRIVSVAKIWGQGPHNAFTDLMRWQDRWYCTFREGKGHVGGNGGIRVLVSEDGQKWQSAALIEEERIDLRDPKFSITPGGRLMIVAGGSVYTEKNVLTGRQPRVMFSADGREWTAPKRVLSEGEWLWRVTWHEGKAYGVSYSSTEGSPSKDWQLTLWQSDDGEKYDLITKLEVPGMPNETTLRFLPDGEMLAMVRREDGNSGWIGVSQPPYREWQWNDAGFRFGGPNFIRLPNSQLWGSSRHYGKTATTVVGPMTKTSFTPALTLPSGGDTSYAGLAWHDDLLWVSYYSSHEGKTSIYLARVELPTQP